MNHNPNVIGALTLRDLFALFAMQSAANNYDKLEDYLGSLGGPSDNESVQKFIADSAYSQADQMLKARIRVNPRITKK